MKIPRRWSDFISALPERSPEVLGNEVSHAVCHLKMASDAEEARGLGEHSVAFEDVSPDDYVHETGFVLQGEKSDAARRTRALPADHHANIVDALAIGHGSNRASVGDSESGKGSSMPLHGMPSRAMRARLIIPHYFFAG